MTQTALTLQPQPLSPQREDPARLSPRRWVFLLAGLALASLGLLVPRPALAQPVLSNLSGPTKAGIYEKFEVRFDLEADYINPFDPDEIEVQALFTSPSGEEIMVPAFYYEAYTRGLLPDKRQILDRVYGAESWMVRFAPLEIGRYHYTIHATDASGTTSTSSRHLDCIPSHSSGFVRADGNRLVFDNGNWFYPIGASTSWCQSLPVDQEYHSWGYGYESTYGFEKAFDEYAKYGGNWNRIWIDTGEWATPSLEGRRTYWNLYQHQVSSSVSHSGDNSAVIENYAETRAYLAEPYHLVSGDTLVYSVDGGSPQTLVFLSSDFAAVGANIGSADAAEVAAVIELKAPLLRALPSLKSNEFYLLLRARPGRPSQNSLRILGGTAQSKLGLDSDIHKAELGRIFFQYKESGGDWRVDPNKTYRFSCWIKTEEVVPDSPWYGAYFGYNNVITSTPQAGTQDWTYYETTITNLHYGRILPQGVLHNAAGRVWFDDISLKEVGSDLELGRDGGFEYLTLKQNRYNMPSAWALDLIFEMAEERGIYIQLMIGRHGSTPENYRKYLRYIVARWGYSTSLLSIEFENENWHDVPWHDEMSTYLASLDPYDHLRTTSLWSAAVIPELWNLQELTLVNLHRYRKDYVVPRIWGLEEGHPRFEKQKYVSSDTSLSIRPGDDPLFGPRLAVEPGKVYLLEYHVKGNNVDGNNGGNLRVTYVANDGTETGAGQGPTLTGTYDWTTAVVPILVPQDITQLRVYMEAAGISAGEVWIDDITFTEGTKILWEDDLEFASYFRPEDWAFYGFEDGRYMRSFNFEKPLIGGEHGLERYGMSGFVQSYIHNGKSNGDPGIDPWDPDFRWDSEGINFQNWLWGTAMGGMSGSTGMWWYVNDSHRHYLGLKRFIEAADDNFVNWKSWSSLDSSGDLTSDNDLLHAYGKISPYHAYVYVHHRYYSWSLGIRDGKKALPESGFITINGMEPGTYYLRQWNPSYTDTSGATSPVDWEAMVSTNPQGQLVLPVSALTSSTAFSVTPLYGGAASSVEAASWKQYR